MSNYFNNSINLDNYFLLRETAKRGDVRYANVGTDLSLRYESLKRSQRIPHVSYSSNSLNFSDMFMGNPLQYIVRNVSSNTRTSQWFNEISYNFNVTFSSLSHYNQFFYYGGRVRITTVHTNASGNKNVSWGQLLDTVGLIEIAEVETYRNDSQSVSTVGATNVSSSYATVYTATSGVYTDNNFRISIRRVSNTVLNILVTYYDGLSGSIDEPVAGATTCYISERRHPTIPAPTYGEVHNLNRTEVNNSPNISVLDVSRTEGNTSNTLNVPVQLSIPASGPDQLCVNYFTRDGTAVSDLVVTPLARDTLGLPFITVIQTDNARVYIDGSFPKWYNMNYNNISSGNMNDKVLTFSRNLIRWLNIKNLNSVLLIGDSQSTNYNVKSVNGTGFRFYWEAATAQENKTLDVQHFVDISGQSESALVTYFSSFGAIIFYSSIYSAEQILTTNVVNALITATRVNSTGIAVISDHGTDDGLTGFFRAANDFLVPGFGVFIKGFVDRNTMTLFVENFEPHPLWQGISGQFPSNASEAYVDAFNAIPDYQSASGTLCFSNGEQTKNIPITIFGDSIPEANEYFDVIIQGQTRGSIIKGTGRVFLNNDD